MPTLKYLGDSFDCATAIKGDDYIHLLDDNGVMVAAFDNISDFSGFTLENGAYTSPTADHSCKVAIIRDDGTIGVGGHTCEDIELGVNAAKNAYAKEEVLSGSTKALYGLGTDAVPDDVFGVVKGLIDSTAGQVDSKAKIATGSYKGTGKSGSSNKNKLTFDFEPKLITFGLLGSDAMFATWIYPKQSGVAYYQSGGTYRVTEITWSGKTISWYASDASRQMNDSNTEYLYFAIG